MHDNRHIIDPIHGHVKFIYRSYINRHYMYCTFNFFIHNNRDGRVVKAVKAVDM